MGTKIHSLWTKDALDKIIGEIKSLRKIAVKPRKTPMHWYMLGLAEEMLAHSERVSLLSNGEYGRHMHSFFASPNWRVRNIAVKLCGKCRDRSFLPLLLTMITDRTPAPVVNRMLGADFVNAGFIRRNAVRSLREIEVWSAEIEDALLQALGDPYWEVRSEAVISLKHLAPGDSAKRNEICSRFSALLKDPSFEVIVEAVGALAEWGESESIINALRPLYYHPNRKVKITVKSASANAIEKIITDDDKREAFGRYSRLKVLNEFDERKIVSQVIKQIL